MAGKTGMKPRRVKPDSVRAALWRTMKIYLKFTIPGLISVTPGATEANVRIFLIRLVRHGYIAKKGNYNRHGLPQEYVMHSNNEPYHTICKRCGQPFSAKECNPMLKNKKKEKEKETKRENAGGDA